VVVKFGKEASQTRAYCVAKNATHRAARPDPSLRKERLLRMTIKLHHCRVNGWFDLFRVCALAPWVIGANVQGKRFVALHLEVAHHFIERWAGGRARRLEPPAAFRATKTPKTQLIDPHQLPIHPPISPRPTSSGCMRTTCWPSEDEAFSFRSSVLNGCASIVSPSPGMSEFA
jgi:hypothetical protein